MAEREPKNKRRFRHAMIVRAEDLRADPTLARDLYAEIWTDGLVGTAIDESNRAKCYIFRKADQMERAVRIARRIGIHSAGPLAEPVLIADEDLQEQTAKHYARMRRR